MRMAGVGSGLRFACRDMVGCGLHSGSVEPIVYGQRGGIEGGRLYELCTTCPDVTASLDC